MFAPYCETCQSRILLGTRSIVHFLTPAAGPAEVLLRCVCGNLVDADAKAPAQGRVPARGDQLAAVAS